MNKFFVVMVFLTGFTGGIMFNHSLAAREDKAVFGEDDQYAGRLDQISDKLDKVLDNQDAIFKKLQQIFVNVN